MDSIKAQNIHITMLNRRNYKYIILRECKNEEDGSTEYWYYSFSNDLYQASLTIGELGNGVIFELDKVIGDGETEVPQEDKSFPCVSLSREDIECLGFSTKDLTNEDLEEIAEKIGENYFVMESWWDALKYHLEFVVTKTH